MNNPLVSVVVPCYNQAQYLSEALQSVLEQTYTNWECIIVNDGSPDETDKEAQKWCAADKRFSYLYKENGGLSSARNAGIAVSNGIYILPLDADDILHPEYLQKVVTVLNENEKLGIVSCKSYFFKPSIATIIYELKPIGTYWRDLLYVNQLVATSLYRKICWEQAGGYDESMKNGFEDWEFWIRITKKGWTYTIVDSFLFYYRKAKKSMLVSTINKSAETNREYISKKHKELYIQDFDNCMEVLFYEIRTHNNSKMQLKNSLEYKIGKIIMKPFRLLEKVVLKNESKL